MATIQALKEKVAAAAEKVTKIEGTIAKHEVAAAKKLAALAKYGVTAENMEQRKRNADGTGSEHYWAICDIESKLEDVKRAGDKLRDAQGILKKWEDSLAAEVNKENFLNEQAPAVIVEFLNQWKEMARDWHIQGHARYVELKDEIKTAEVAAREAVGRGWGKEYSAYLERHTGYDKARRELKGLGGVVASMSLRWDETERLEYLEKVLEADRKAKMFDLINRVTEVVGTITDAGHLEVNNKGNLDGVVIGERGRARVETIGVGGYNIVCFHFRTNVYALEAEPLKLGKSKPLTPELCELHYQAKREVEAEQDGQLALTLEDARSGGGPGTVDGKLGQQMYMNL